MACFLRHCLLVSTDRLLLMVRRRVADLWRIAAVGVDAKLTDWARLYQELLGELARLVSDPGVSSETMREQLLSLIQAHRARRPRSRAEIVRERLIEGVRPVRALLKALTRLPWQAAPAHPLLEALGVLRGLYERDRHDLPVSLDLPVGRVWRAALESPDRERAFAALEVATLLNLRRALRNGTVWIEHSLSFRSRETLFIPEPQWQQSRRAHYRRLSLSADPKDFLEPLIERAQVGVAAVAEAAGAGVLKVDDELHLTPLAAQEEDPKIEKLRIALDRRIGEAQLPQIILGVDAQVRFSWIMLGREPRSASELLMVYAGALGGRDRAHDPAALPRLGPGRHEVGGR